jgi:hypothetical protein
LHVTAAYASGIEVYASTDTNYGIAHKVLFLEMPLAEEVTETTNIQ